MRLQNRALTGSRALSRQPSFFFLSVLVCVCSLCLEHAHAATTTTTTVTTVTTVASSDGGGCGGLAGGGANGSNVVVQMPQGYYVTRGEVCKSWIMFPGMELWSPGAMAFVSLLGLVYVFLGVAIVSDAFMSAIEVITSKETEVKRLNPVTSEVETISMMFWNPTVANLSLMALGSSAPEILLSVLETLFSFDSCPGELGPSTIVGSAAFNLLIISAICIMAIPNGEVRRVEEFGVFLLTAGWSLFAYFWLLVVLVMWTPDYVTVTEACITFLCFPLLLFSAFALDKRSQMKKERETLGRMTGANITSDAGVMHPDHRQLVSMMKEYVSHHHHDNASVASQRNSSHHNHGDASDDQRTVVSGSDVKSAAANIVRLMTANPVQRSAMAWRVNARRALVGRKHAVSQSRSDEHAVGLDEDALQPEKMAKEKETGSKVFFTATMYNILENAGHVEVGVRRSGPCEDRVSVEYFTSNGTAEAGSDYVAQEGVLTFEPLERIKKIKIEIIDDDEFEDDETFHVSLRHPSAGLSLGSPHITTVLIIDDDDPGKLLFEHKQYNVSEEKEHVEINVVRHSGAAGIVSVRMSSKDGNAEAGKDYVAFDERIEFEPGQTTKAVFIALLPQNELGDESRSFTVHLSEPLTAELGRGCMALVNIVPSEAIAELEDVVAELVARKASLFSLETSSWRDQFHDAMTLEGGVDDAGEALPPTLFETVMHFLSFGWKVLFAFIPPSHYCGGWLAFGVALFFIGVVTAVVGELANIFGCSIGLPPSVTAITFVALGTSLPDTFASKQAAEEQPNADAAIGNVTGSNSVNVFLGLGLPWFIASIYYQGKGLPGHFVPAGDLSFSVLIFTIVALLCLGLLVLRRKESIAGGELGGPVAIKMASAAFCIFLWLLYITLSIAQAGGSISNPFPQGTSVCPFDN